MIDRLFDWIHSLFCLFSDGPRNDQNPSYTAFVSQGVETRESGVTREGAPVGRQRPRVLEGGRLSAVGLRTGRYRTPSGPEVRPSIVGPSVGFGYRPSSTTRSGVRGTGKSGRRMSKGYPDSKVTGSTFERVIVRDIDEEDTGVT